MAKDLLFVDPMEGFLNPNEVFKKIKLRKNMIAADFGCGSGGWAIPLAKRLEEGKVLAIDILEEPLSALRGKMKLEKVFNIETILTDIERGVKIENDSLDFVLMTNLLFQIENKKGVFQEAKRVLKKGGEILVIDWQEKAPLGPKEGRISPNKIKEIISDLSLKVEKEFNPSPYHWGLLLIKE